MWVLLHRTEEIKSLTMPSKTLWSTSGDRRVKKQTTPRGRHLQSGASGTPNPGQRTGQKGERDSLGRIPKGGVAGEKCSKPKHVKRQKLKPGD